MSVLDAESDRVMLLHYSAIYSSVKFAVFSITSNLSVEVVYGRYFFFLSFNAGEKKNKNHGKKIISFVEREKRAKEEKKRGNDEIAGDRKAGRNQPEVGHYDGAAVRIVDDNEEAEFSEEHGGEFGENTNSEGEEEEDLAPRQKFNTRKRSWTEAELRGKRSAQHLLVGCFKDMVITRMIVR